MAASFSAEQLPSSAAITITPAVRLAYVLQHFWLAYEQEPPITIGYAPDDEVIVTVLESANHFFTDLVPYPLAPNWRTWQGQCLPFFFDNSPKEELLTLTPGRARINADIVSAAFYLLSGWQEYFSAERDRHGRFPYAVSVQKQYGFVALPVVNYYFEVLKTALEHVAGRPLQPRRWAGGAPFAAFISHDLDNLRSAWKAPVKAALRQGRLLDFGQQLIRHFVRPDAWDNLEPVAAAVAQHGARSTFFVLPSRRPAPDGTPNADYRLSAHLWKRLRRLEGQGCQLALHGSIGTAVKPDQLRFEAHEATSYSTQGIRFHYLCWEPRLTPALLDSESFSFDSTLGFAEHYGFRNSYCHPFYPFNFSTGRAHSFLEIPLNVMDATLHHPNYLQLAPAEIMPALTPLLAEVEKFGGVASVLWHNQNFDPANTANGPQQFHEIMGWLRGHGAAFLTAREIWAQFSAA